MTDEHKALNFTISSPGWLLYLQRSGERQKDYMAKLLDPAKQRGELMPDDYIRGYIQALIWSATWPRQEVEAAMVEDQEEQKLIESERKYDHIAEYGYSLGIDSQGEELEING